MARIAGKEPMVNNHVQLLQLKKLLNLNKQILDLIRDLGRRVWIPNGSHLTSTYCALAILKTVIISALVPTLLMGLTDPNDHSRYSLDILLQTTFINSFDSSSIALLVPIVHRGLRERSAETKRKMLKLLETCARQ